MKNLKHSILAMIAVAMISSLAAVQANDLKKTDIVSKLSTGVQTMKISVENTEDDAENVNEASEEKTASEKETQEAEEEIETSPEAAAKENPETAYVSLTSGTLNVRETPSTESNVIDSLDACDEVKILSSSDGWYTIAYDGGKTGYVSSSEITNDKDDAEYNAMHYDNYKKAQVITYGGVANVRSEASKDADVTDQLEDGTQVVTLWEEGDYIKVAYGQDYTEGYIVNTAIDLTGEWVAKSTVSERQEEVAEEKAEAERAEARARENSARAASASSSASSSQSSSSSLATATPSFSSSSNKGQAIVNTAMQYLGVPYVWGGTSPSGFDCSGLVQYVCNKNGISVSRVAADQSHNGTYVSRDNLQPGDLVFFGKSGISHVGIYIGNGNMIHAPQTGDVVKISSINTEYRISSYAGACRVW